MEYAQNILPSEAAYYKLTNASIVSGKLTLNANGSAEISVTQSMLASATEYFMVSLVPNKPTDSYAPKVYIDVDLEMETGDCFSYTVCPVETLKGVLSAELKVKSGTYKKFVVNFRSTESISFMLWELCPEASDTDVQVIIDGVKQSLPRLLYDYNMWPLVVQQEETTIGLISYNLLDATDIQGHLEVTYVASKGCVLTLRFKDMDNTELYAPLLFDVKPGRGSIGVPHAYLDRVAGMHTASVTAQVTQGQLSIGIRGIMFTIDGGYLAERVIDLAADVQDIGIKQTQVGYEPEEIWTVGIDAGEVLVKNRPYKTDKIDTAFTPQYTLGEGKAAAIEFNGYWYLPIEEETYTLITDKVPWVFWIDSEDTLWCQLGQDANTLLQLDTQVSYVQACRCYKSEMDLNQDQGLVCLYLKNGRAYYRQYIYRLDISREVWAESYEVDSSKTDIVHCSISRLLDYRTQITLVTANNTATYITDRTYVTQAVPPEIAHLGFADYSLPLLYAPKDFTYELRCIAQEVSKDFLTYTATFNSIIDLKGYVMEQEIFTFDDIVKQNNDKISVTVQYDLKKETTTVTAKLTNVPNTFKVYMHVNADQTCRAQLKIDNYGTVICPYLDVEWSIQPWIDPIETTLLGSGAFNFNYQAINKVKKELIEPTIFSTAILNMKYIQKQVIKQELTEVVNLGNSTLTISYTATQSQPI